jgi:phenylpropionate dioxygenase-like ring-hydroxylating dioxygenase large terminal subunit
MTAAVSINVPTRYRGRKRLRDLLAENPDVDPLPEGWFVVEFSRAVENDKLISKRWLGEDIVLYRDPRTGEVVVMQAHCPHMGGHFDAYRKGGCVENGVVTCPYHHMRFDPPNQGDSLTGRGRPRLRTYPTFEAHGFVLALRQRDSSRPPLPRPDLHFEGVDESQFVFGAQTLGQFDGDSVVPLMAMADYHHFQTVHGHSYAEGHHDFAESADGNSATWSIRHRDRYASETHLRPLMGGNWNRRRQKKWHKLVVPDGEEAKIQVIAKCTGGGAGLTKSDIWEPIYNLHLLSLFYVTPIDPFRFELYANCGVKTIKPLRRPWAQSLMNKLGSKLHLWANDFFAKEDDLPFYTDGKIRLARPAYTREDDLLKSYVDWWKRHSFSPAYLEMIEGYDLDFR